jgi:hypothetical protein
MRTNVERPSSESAKDGATRELHAVGRYNFAEAIDDGAETVSQGFGKWCLPHAPVVVEKREYRR